MPNSTFTRVAGGVVAGAVCALTPDATALQREGVVIPKAIQSNPEVQLDRPSASHEGWGVSVEFSKPEWTSAKERQYRSLVVKMAAGSMTPAERAAFDRFTSERRLTKSPRTSQEILWEHKQRQVTRRLMDAIAEYAQFHDFSTQSAED